MIASVTALVVATALLLGTVDPAGDAFGNGTLLPPSAPVYGDATAFDLRELRVEGDDAITLQITMGSLSNPAGLPLGFTHPVIEVYLDTAEGGAGELLPGSDMRMPAGSGWEFAVRLTGDGATGYAHRPDATPVALPVGVRVTGSTLEVTTPFEAVSDPAAFAVVGLYDPLGEAVWRPLTRELGTWSFSSAEQRRPVIDVLAPTAEAQATAIDGGVLPSPRRSTSGSVYLLLMAVGLVVALLGLLLRRRVAPTAAPTAAAPTGAAADGAAAPGNPDGGAEARPAHRPLHPPAGAGVPARAAAAGAAASGAESNGADSDATRTEDADPDVERLGADELEDVAAERAGAAQRKPYGWNGAAQSGDRGVGPDRRAAVVAAGDHGWLRDDDPFAAEFGALFGEASAATPAAARSAEAPVSGAADAEAPRAAGVQALELDEDAFLEAPLRAPERPEPLSEAEVAELRDELRAEREENEERRSEP